MTSPILMQFCVDLPFYPENIILGVGSFYGPNPSPHPLQNPLRRRCHHMKNCTDIRTDIALAMIMSFWDARKTVFYQLIASGDMFEIFIVSRIVSINLTTTTTRYVYLHFQLVGSVKKKVKFSLKYPSINNISTLLSATLLLSGRLLSQPPEGRSGHVTGERRDKHYSWALRPVLSEGHACLVPLANVAQP